MTEIEVYQRFWKSAEHLDLFLSPQLPTNNNRAPIVLACLGIRDAATHALFRTRFDGM